MIVAFVYRIGSVKYDGKYIGYLTDQYEEGLDHELKRVILPSLLSYYHISDPDMIKIGIMSHQRLGSDYFSEDEKYAFDLLYCNWSNQTVEIFFEGNPYKIQSL
jgi:hypothetical protein